MKVATYKRTQTLLDKGLLKVLLVEDESTDRMSVERILRTCSSPVEFVVESAVTLSEAIGNLAEKQYDAILLDLELPDSSGIETLRQVVKVAPDIPVVVLTELEDEQIGFSALEDGATDYLVKDLPLDVVLVRTIIYALQRKKIQMQTLKLAHDINERMKELNCLYGISKLVGTPGISLEEIFEKTVCLIPAGWQYPGVACAKIVIGDSEFRTKNFTESAWKQSAPIKVYGSVMGKIEVGYLEERPELDEGPFLGEERSLIDVIGQQLGKMAERIKGEEALLESEKKFKNLVEATSDWIWECDKEGLYTYASPRIKNLFGYEVSEVLGKTPFDLMPEEERVKLGKFFKEKLAKKEAFYGLENTCRHKDGHLVNIETSAVPVFDDEGQLKGYRGIDRDITERKNMEEALHRNEARYRSSVELTGQLIWTTDSNGEVVEDIPLWRKFTGLSYEETKGSSWTKALHPEDAEHTRQVWDNGG